MSLTTNKYTKSSKWCYLDAETLQPRVTPHMALELNDKDIAVAKVLKAWSMPTPPKIIHPPTPSNIIHPPTSSIPPTPSNNIPPTTSSIPPTPTNAPPTPSKYSPAFKTTEEMEIKKFCGYVGKVYKKMSCMDDDGLL